jgi:hypothetical protein
VDIPTALQEIHPDCMVVDLGKYRVFRFRTSTPAHTFDSIVLKTCDESLVELTSRDSFDKQLAEFLLDQVVLVGLPSRRARGIRVAAATFPKPWAFNAFVIAPPAVANRFEHRSKTLRRITYWVVPAFEGEFVDRANRDAFWHQVYRKDGWRSVVVWWDRLPKTQPFFEV